MSRAFNALVQNKKIGNKMSYNPEVPYNSLPLLPPTAEVESMTILKKKHYGQ